jgi:predicted dehydrogenase
MTDSIGVAVIGARMAGRSHAHAYRTAQTVFGADAPPVRLVAIADVNTDSLTTPEIAMASNVPRAAGRPSRTPTISTLSASWLPITCTARSLKRCWHPASTCCAKSRSRRPSKMPTMVKAADASGLVAACGFSYRRSPAVSAIGEQIKTGALGEIQHFNGRYWCDCSADPDAPTSWR